MGYKRPNEEFFLLFLFPDFALYSFSFYTRGKFISAVQRSIRMGVGIRYSREQAYLPSPVTVRTNFRQQRSFFSKPRVGGVCKKKKKESRTRIRNMVAYAAIPLPFTYTLYYDLSLPIQEFFSCLSPAWLSFFHLILVVQLSNTGFPK